MKTVWLVYATSDFTEEPMVGTAVYTSMYGARNAAYAMVFAEIEPQPLNFVLDHDELVAVVSIESASQTETITVRLREVHVKD